MLAARFAPGTANGVGPLLSPRGRYRTYRQGDLKLALHLEGGEQSVHLFDLAADPGELDDLAARDAAELARMQQELAVWETALGLPGLDRELTLGDSVAPPEMDDAAAEQLRALGYIE